MGKPPSIMLQFWEITILILIRLSLSRSQARYHKDLNFNPLTFFEALLKDHPLWNQLNNVLTIGAFFPLWDISASTRKDDINFHLKRGNLKSATTYHNIFDLLIKEDVERGFAIPLPLDIIELIPSGSIAPLGCMKQETINELGSRILKFCMTYNQMFPGPLVT